MMADEVFSDGPFGAVERKLPIIGQAVAGAIEKLTSVNNPYVFALFVIDPTTGLIVWTSNGECESFRAALQEFLARHAH